MAKDKNYEDLRLKHNKKAREFNALKDKTSEKALKLKAEYKKLYKEMCKMCKTKEVKDAKCNDTA